MSHRLTPRRLPTTMALALAGGLLLAPSPAQADVIGSGDYESDIRVSTLGGPACTISNTGEEDDHPVVDGGAPLNHSLSVVDATITNDGDPSDVTTLNGTVSSSFKQTTADGSLQSLDYSGSGEISLDKGADGVSACNSRIIFDSNIDLDNVVIARDSWVSYDYQHRGGAYSELYFESEDVDDTEFDVFAEGFKQSSRGMVFLPAGEYEVYIEIYADVRYDDVFSKSGSASVSLEVIPAGSATTKLVGSGKKYVAIPSSVDCASDSIKPKLKANAKKLAFAKFFVNGKKAKTVKKPGKNKRVTLGSLKSDEATTVKVVVKTKKIVKKTKKGKKVIKPKKFTVTRSYLACD